MISLVYLKTFTNLQTTQPSHQSTVLLRIIYVYSKSQLWKIHTQFWTQFHNNWIRLNFNPKYSMQKYMYFRQIYQECLKTECYLLIYINISYICWNNTANHFEFELHSIRLTLKENPWLWNPALNWISQTRAYIYLLHRCFSKSVSMLSIYTVIVWNYINM